MRARQMSHLMNTPVPLKAAQREWLRRQSVEGDEEWSTSLHADSMVSITSRQAYSTQWQGEMRNLNSGQASRMTAYIEDEPGNLFPWR